MTVVIPQTREQAISRDLAAGLADAPLVQTVEAQLALLRNAVRQHQATIESAGPIGLTADLTGDQNQIAETKHEADRILWAHLEG